MKTIERKGINFRCPNCKDYWDEERVRGWLKGSDGDDIDYILLCCPKCKVKEREVRAW